MPAPKIFPKPVIVAFFLIGLLSSVAFRAIILFQKYHPGWVRPVWYFGVVGYSVFFVYRFFISQRRKRTIAETQLITKLQQAQTLEAEDREAALYLLNSIRKSPEDWNYMAIFALSLVAVVLDIFLPGN